MDTSPRQARQAAMVRLRSKAGWFAAALTLFFSLHGGAAQYDGCANGTSASIGNGQCDPALNTASCGFDGGDCCPCTCSDGPAHSCTDSDFDCLYPACDESPTTTDEASTCVEEWQGDGKCDEGQNVASCAYDGGDCCACTCVDGPEYPCGAIGFACRDPTCFDPAAVAEFPDCTGSWAQIGDGYCDDDTNVLSCGYDGGDCCLCSCTGSACGLSVFDCLDPIAGDEFYECEAPPPASTPCSVEGQKPWVVNDSTQAQALAAAVNCSGGSFQVEWRGRVMLDAPIYVADGTSLTISGADRSTAAIDGNASTRLFTVVDAALYLANLNVSYGASTAGGAIAATGSTLTFNRTNFIGNTAAGEGGAVFASGESSVSCVDGTTFVENTAGVDGGAMFITSGSAVSCGASWFRNTATVRGGAIRVEQGSSLSWSEESTFGFNTAGSLGGVLSLVNFSSLSWKAPTAFYSNSAGVYGGVLSASDNCDISWNAGTGFYSNGAGIGGGAVFVRDGSNVSWSDDTSTVFDGNQAGTQGGAVMVSAGALAVSTAETTSTYSGNSALHGGAVYVEFNSSVSFGGTSSFEGNNALIDPQDVNASSTGGALVAFSASATLTGTVNFTGNNARLGGALYSMSSDVEVDAQAVFMSNSASEDGGAVYVWESNVAWNGQTTMASNSAADRGGALDLRSANISWDGNAEFLRNSAGSDGGAANVGNCTVTWNGDATFTENRAVGTEDIEDTVTRFGGALYLFTSKIVWNARTTMASNSAYRCGAVYISDTTMTWGGNTEFVNNSAERSTGAVGVWDSSVVWDGDAIFAENVVAEVVEDSEEDISYGLGGAVSAGGGASVVWSGGSTQFIKNIGSSGSALYIHAGARATWDGLMMEFINNSATVWGTLFVADAEVSWSGKTEFRENVASSGGGAIFIANGSYVGWTGETGFVSNEAPADGGAIASPGLDPVFNLKESTLQIGGTTTFLNNTSGANGGGVALLGACSLGVDSGVDVSYVGNFAAIAGGAVFVSGAGAGPAFNNTSFTSNRAQVGGAVSMVGSGNAKGVEDVAPPNPTMFNRCQFVGNRALATGGAIESASGYDWMMDSTFEDNVAGTGGALRLAGTASIDRCSFVENFSDDGQGAAVSNIGSLWRVANNSFRGNGFTCPAATFLDFNTSGNPYEAVCDGCQPDCDGCVFAEPNVAPICAEVLDHSKSPGGKVTVESLSIQPGYWRASAFSEDVFECYHADACLGGVTGASNYCREGYEGPYCAICSDGYSAQFGFICAKCSDNAGGIVLAAFVCVAAVVVAVAVVSYVTTGEGLGRKRRWIDRVARYVPLQSVKVVVVVWQILTQFTAVANVTYPGVYQTFLDGLSVFNFDLSWVLSAGCVFDVDFHDRLLISTIGPIVAALVLVCTYSVSARIHREAPETLQLVWHKHVSMFLLLTFFVYSSVSSTIFRAFACEELADGKYYLRSDYRIECDSAKHRGFQVYAGLMMLVYTVGIPAFYGVLLYRDRDVLKKEDRSSFSRVSSISDLWKPYKPSVYYYEVIECCRRILLAGVVVFIYPNTSAQIAITIMIAFAFVIVSEGLAPYASRWDHWISRTGHIVVVVSMYLALLLKVDASDERSSSQKVFEAVLIAIHVVMVLAVLVETVVLALGLRAEHREDPWPRLRVSGKTANREKGGEEEDAAYWESHNPFADHVQETKKVKPAGTV